MTTVIAPQARAPASPPSRPPNRLAERITGRPYLSHSQLTTMRSCPRKFAFHYVEKIQGDHIPSILIFGGSIHSALEFYFRAKLEGLEVTAGAMLSAYHDAWRRQIEQAGKDVPVRFNKGEDQNILNSLADRIIAAFLTSPLASPKGIILGVEEELRVVLDLDLPDLLAKVDLVTQTDGALHVIDFKTSRSRWTDAKAEESGEQLQLYAITVARMSQHLGVPVKLHFAIVTKAKTPVVQLIPVATDTGRAVAITENVRQVWEAIQTGNFYPSPSPLNCTTCQFKSRCPVFGGK
jgi:CRISPR/Cas system-associated exonuclease Cas4 (RecB family)